MDNENTITKEEPARRIIPKQAYDSEYFTEWRREVDFLFAKGINYVFTRKTPTYGITQYKYTKTPELFAALTIFYAMIQAERAQRPFKQPYPKTEEKPKTEDDTE